MDLENEGASLDAQNLESTENQPTSEVTSEPVSQPSGNPSDERLAQLERIVASDPSLRQRYEAEKAGIYYQPQYPPQPQYQHSPIPPQQTQEQKPRFNGEPFDPYNPEHQAELLEEKLNPFKSFIDHTQQQNRQYEEQQFMNQIGSVEQQIHSQLDKQLPGYAEEPLLAQHAQGEFQKVLQRDYHPSVWLDPRIHQAVLMKITPSLKNYYSKLKGPVPQGQQVDPAMARENYVEGSNAVPTTTANPFDKAYQKNDVFGMVQAISRHK